MHLLLLLNLSLLFATPTDWPDLVQKPYDKLPIPDLGLRPLLVNADGKKITKKGEWEKSRQALHDAWLERLGKSA
jgi:hypothetical protein